MKITDLRPFNYWKPYDTPISNGKYTYYGSSVNLCHIDTDEGITGIGWVGGGAIVHETLKQLKDYVVGEDPFDTEKIWAKMYLPKVFGRKGLTTRAISAVDIAIWDCIGKAMQKPIYKLLGGYTNSIRAYIAGGYYQKGKGLKGLADEMEQNLKQGATAIKMKIGAAPIREDAERIRVVRETIGPDIDLLVDVNNAYSVNDAIRMVPHLEKYDCFWYEEPVSCDDIPGQAAVTAASAVPVAVGENEYTRWGFRDLVANKCAKVLNADAQVLGGITEWKKVADLAAAYDIPVAPHGSQEVHIHLVTAIPNGLILEYYNANVVGIADEMFEERAPMLKGYVSPPEKPGLGLSFNYKGMEKYRIA